MTKIKLIKMKAINLTESDYFVWDSRVWEVYKTGRTLLHKHKFVCAKSRRYIRLNEDYIFTKFYECGKSGDEIVENIIVKK